MMKHQSGKCIGFNLKHTLYCQKYSLTCLDSQMKLSDIPFLIHRVYDVSPPFAVTTALTLLGRLSTRFRSVHGNFWPFFQKHICEVTHWCWTGRPLSLSSNSSQRCSIRLRSGLCAGQSSSSTPNPLIHVFMHLALCTDAQSCWNWKGPSPNCSHKVGSRELSNISWCAEAFRVPFTVSKGPSLAPGKKTTTP